MTRSVFFRSKAAVLGVALLTILPMPAPAKPAASILPVAWNLDAAQVASSCKESIARVKSRTLAVAAVPAAKRNFVTVVLAIENASADFNDELAAQTFLYAVAADAKVRAASLQCSTDAGNVQSELAARPELYRAIADARASGTARGAAQQKLTELWLTVFKRSGAGLPPLQRREFVTLSQKLNDLQNTFTGNLASDATTIAIDVAQADSLPPDFVAGALKRSADGGYTVPVNESTVGPFMQNERDAAARKAFYVAYNNRGGDPNVKLLEQAIAVRDRLAHLLGYPTWAAFVLADRMASSPQRVDAFLSRIDAAIIGKARQERDEDAALKGAPLEQWDKSYYENLLRKTKYAVDSNEIKQYFPVGHVVESVFGIYQDLLGVRFTRANVAAWDPQVQAFDVTDAATNAPLGRFFLDLYPRPGKYNHFANFGMLPRRVLPDGTIRLAQTAIVGNWPQPAPGASALLTHGDVETFFHEFGHCMAAILADQPYEMLSSGFRQDFVEAPSQMLENWAWDPGILKRVSQNVTTGQPLPDDLIGKMIAARFVHYALQTTGQILYATADIRYHSRKPPFDTTTVWKATVAETTPDAFVDGTHPQASFGHIMSGYDVGYYGYLWSKVYAQDMFSKFAAQGLTNPAAGSAYRNDILAPARLQEPDVEVAHFLGRPMSPDAFYRELGIAPPQSSHR